MDENLKSILPAKPHRAI